MAIRRTIAEFSDDIATADIADDAITGGKLANNIAISTTGAITTTGAFTSIGIDDNASGATAITIDSSENIVLGNTTGEHTVGILAGTSNACKLQMGDSGSGTQCQLVYNNSNDSLGFRVNGSGSDAIHIKSDSNIGIGTTSPTALLHIDRGTTTSLGFRLYSNTGNTQEGGPTPIAVIEQDGAGDAYIAFGLTGVASGHIGMDNTGDLFRLTNQGDWGTNVGLAITTSNKVLVAHGNTGDNATLQVEQASTGEAGIRIYKPTNDYTNAQKFLEFLSYDGNWRANGRITGNGSGVAAFQSWSDERLKENVVTITGQLDLINQLRPVTFDWKADGSSAIGFIAQELKTVLPDNVSTDEPTEQQIDDGETGTMWITAWSSTEARLVGAIQELSAKNDALEAKVATLEAVENDSSSSNAALEARIIALEAA